MVHSGVHIYVATCTPGAVVNLMHLTERMSIVTKVTSHVKQTSRNTGENTQNRPQQRVPAAPHEHAAKYGRILDGPDPPWPLMTRASFSFLWRRPPMSADTERPPPFLLARCSSLRSAKRSMRLPSSSSPSSPPPCPAALFCALVDDTEHGGREGHGRFLRSVRLCRRHGSPLLPV